MNIPSFTITNNETNQRYDKFLRKYCKPYPLISLKDIFARIRKGYIKVNNRKKKENYRLQLNDEISFDQIPPSEHYKFLNDKGKAKKHIDIHLAKKWIIYEDNQRLAFNKPAGLIIHGGTKNTDTISLHDHLQRYVFSQQEQNSTQEHIVSPTFSPSFCYRIDKDTSGVVIAAMTYPALQLLNELIRERKVSKQYHTIVIGKTPLQGTVEAPLFKGFDKKLGRSKSFVNKERGKHAITHYQTIETIQHPKLGLLSLLQIEIETGRMHQIRVHLAYLGYPVLGDIMYGVPVINRLLHKHEKINRQLLHANQYTFFDSIQNKEISIKANFPTDFTKLFPHIYP